ncbi:MAG: GldG family protein [Sulfuricella denitrificans]|nr:GldG family protein [Sulfuricella denitrificans]
MKIFSRAHFWLRRHHRIYVLLLLCVVSAMGVLSQRHEWQRDVTQNGRHTLSTASSNVLREMPGPVTVTAYATLQDMQLGDLRRPIRDFIARYQGLKSDVALKFIDPLTQPGLARTAGVRVNGEMILSYSDRSEHLATLNEQDFTNTLMRLSRGHERQVMSVSGHGERRLDGSAPHDLGEFGRQLAYKGFHATASSLALVPEVPAEVNILLLTQPRTPIPPGEADKIKRYLARGGNLLWLLEPGLLQGLLPVAETLGLALTPGIVVDPAARESGSALATVVVAQYGPHPVTEQFDLITLYPQARAIGMNDDPGWHVTPLLETSARTWVENGVADEHASFNEGQDIPGPVVIGWALERQLEEVRQRVVVIGSADFLANGTLGNAGNLDLGINLFNWLSGDSRLITIQPKNTLDASLNLGQTGMTIIASLFLAALPLVFFATAVLTWRRRRNS